MKISDYFFPDWEREEGVFSLDRLGGVAHGLFMNYPQYKSICIVNTGYGGKRNVKYCFLVEKKVCRFNPA